MFRADSAEISSLIAPLTASSWSKCGALMACSSHGPDLELLKPARASHRGRAGSVETASPAWSRDRRSARFRAGRRGSACRRGCRRSLGLLVVVLHVPLLGCHHLGADRAHAGLAFRYVANGGLEALRLEVQRAVVGLGGADLDHLALRRGRRHVRLADVALEAHWSDLDLVGFVAPTCAAFVRQPLCRMASGVMRAQVALLALIVEPMLARRAHSAPWLAGRLCVRLAHGVRLRPSMSSSMMRDSRSSESPIDRITMMVRPARLAAS